MPPASCPAPQARTARGRLVRVARTYSTEAPRDIAVLLLLYYYYLPTYCYYYYYYYYCEHQPEAYSRALSTRCAAQPPRAAPSLSLRSAAASAAAGGSGAQEVGMAGSSPGAGRKRPVTVCNGGCNRM